MLNNPVFLAVVTDESVSLLANQTATSLGFSSAIVVHGNAADAAQRIQSEHLYPRYILLDIGNRTFETLSDIDVLAEHCPPDVQVIAVGQVNDIRFYRELIQRGVLEYFPLPVDAADLKKALVDAENANRAGGDSKVITFMSAASGDGASSVALNTAYCLARYAKKRVVIIDMDFQFGMVARNLDLSTPFGIKELFEHPDREVDETLIQRMLVEYTHNMYVIAAPSDLRMWPDIKPEMIHNLLQLLRQQFDFVIVDLPHIWSHWLSAAINVADHNVLVAQLWLRSVTHTARILGVFRESGVTEKSVISVINRSGAKFKEAVTATDYENVCRKSIDFYLANDIKTIVSAENEGKTVPEVGSSLLAKQFRELASHLVGENLVDENESALNQTATKGPLSSLASAFTKR